ncbi:MAG: response regulator, partial [candidate division NC10 bacterium]|nr:response regulator [candidate division NC10 bacterium]
MNGVRLDERDKVLVVDDEEGIARMIQVLLESKGFSTFVANSGKTALELLGSSPVDLVLLDIMMPGFDGYQVLRQIKEDEELRHLPVILLTAKDGLKDKVEGLRLGADDYIT